WRVNKYVVNNQDKTFWFDTARPNFGWVFREDKTFSQFWDITYTVIEVSVDTVYNAEDSTVIDRVDTTWTPVERPAQKGVSGSWTLINSNKYLQTRDDSTGVNQYKIVKHKTSSLHLFKGNEDFYLVPLD